MNTSFQPKGKVRLYAAGGCGTNIGAQLEKYRNKDEVAFAQLDIVYIDTSKSNLRSHIDPEHTYLLDGLDGSGKVRAENHAEIAKHVRAIMQKYPPQDLNIVISSAAGGSGSVIAPLLVSEMLSKEIPTVVIAIGSADTRLDAENTLKTIKSYESIAKMRKIPVAMYYVQNSVNIPRAEADRRAIETVMGMCILFSRENRELDSRDLFNFLRYDRVTDVQPALVSLTIQDGSDFSSDLGHVLTVATLTKEHESPTLSIMPEVQYTGHLPHGTIETVMTRTPVHYIVSDGIITDITFHLTRILAGVSESRAARIQRNNILDSNDDTTSTGLVL